MAADITAIFYTTMVGAALVMDLAFGALGWIPASRPDIRAEMVQFSFNYTFWLNLVFGALALGLFLLARRAPAQVAHCCGHHAHHPQHAHHHE
jgi:hypothetical protein